MAFHGIKNLSQNEFGMVYWSDVCVEHFSHSDPLLERRAALTLGAVCAALEDQGTAVTVNAVADFQRRLQLAQDINAPKYLCAWVVGGNSKELVRVAQLVPTSRAECGRTEVTQAQIDFGRRDFERVNEDLYAKQSGFVRSFVVTTQETFQDLLMQVKADFEWLAYYGTAADRYLSGIQQERVLACQLPQPKEPELVRQSCQTSLVDQAKR